MTTHTVRKTARCWKKRAPIVGFELWLLSIRPSGAHYVGEKCGSSAIRFSGDREYAARRIANGVAGDRCSHGRFAS
jgi:hypothetical protein